ncbi:KNR4/SMI1 homolog [Beta vulgaris subsp. vulgaris]|uniref:KNR4/SMI1 homolog n=1 Tax=Beta vulgaris subsp. vulgaris TaxID=3555 RepID=UPI0025483267|nr:KNR4/SMI1 homolog [Beta vulgaris subsp. vulgaris]
MTKVAEDRLALVQEVQDLRRAARTHLDELYQAKEAKRLAELRLDEANTKITKGEAAWKQEKEDWKVERANLSLAKENAESAKVAAESKQARVGSDLERVKFKLSTAEAQLKEAQAAVSRSQEEWFKAWQASDDCTEFCAEVGQSSHKMGEDEAFTKLREALADSCPEADWNSVWSRYQELADAEAAVIKAKMAEEMSSDDEDDDDEEAANTEPPPGKAVAQPDAEQPAAGPST